jgi:hypothetical protein
MIGCIIGRAEGQMQTNNDPLAPRGARLLSVGHSHHPLGRLIELLRGAGVTAVADVRSHPFSQRQPQHNRPELEQALAEHDITYLYLGDLLGGRPGRPSLYDEDGRVDYERVRTTPAFRQGLARLGAALEEHRVAMLCAEEDPLDCHRGLMITPALAEQGIAVDHLRGNGWVESGGQFERRLLEITKVGTGLVGGLFEAMLTAKERRQLLAEAYREQARRKAFRLRPGDGLASEEMAW